MRKHKPLGRSLIAALALALALNGNVLVALLSSVVTLPVAHAEESVPQEPTDEPEQSTPQEEEATPPSEAEGEPVPSDEQSLPSENEQTNAPEILETPQETAPEQQPEEQAVTETTPGETADAAEQGTEQEPVQEPASHQAAAPIDEAVVQEEPPEENPGVTEEPQTPCEEEATPESTEPQAVEEETSEPPIEPSTEDTATAEESENFENTECKEGECTTPAQVETENHADVRTTPCVHADTGHNEASGENGHGDASIETGDANGVVILENAVNTTQTEAESDHGNSDVALETRTTNEATVANDVTVIAETGQNTANGNDESTIETGDANVFVSAVNSVNATFTGSNFEQLLVNVTDTLTGDINLVDILLGLFAADAGSGSYGSTEVATANVGVLDNLLRIAAATGGNTANENEDASITTGDVNVAASVINLVNTTVVGSNWLFATINILGEFVGDIILPGEGILPMPTRHACPDASSVVTTNGADVTNAVTVNGSTGGNTAEGEDGASIITGDVNVSSSVENTVNTTEVGSFFLSFLPHLFGNWIGEVVGGESMGSLGSGDCIPSGELAVDTDNRAEVTTAIDVNATTGGNTAIGNEDTASIQTGDVNVATDIVNLVNSTFVGSHWLRANVNLFGTWRGNLVYAYPDLSIENHHEEGAALGEELTYELHFSNGGLAPARSVQILDTLPAHTTFLGASDDAVLQDGVLKWELAALPAKTTDRVVTFRVRVNDEVPDDVTAIINRVVVQTTTPEPNTTNNASGSEIPLIRHVAEALASDPPANEETNPSPEVMEPIPAPALSITKTNDAQNAIAAGSRVSYHITVTNTGNVPVSDLVVHDQLPSQTGKILFEKDFTLGELPSSGSASVSYILVVSEKSPSGRYTNTATVRGIFAEREVTAMPASSTVEVTEPPVAAASDEAEEAVVTLVSSTPEPPPPVDAPALTVSQTKTVTGIVHPGDYLTFAVAVYNNGNVPLFAVTATETLVNGEKKVTDWGIGTLQPREEVTIEYTLALAASAPPGPYTNTSFAIGKTERGDAVRSHTVSSTFTVEALALALGGIPAAVAAEPPPPASETVLRWLGPASHESALRTLLPWWLMFLAICAVAGLRVYLRRRALIHKQRGAT